MSSTDCTIKCCSSEDNFSAASLVPDNEQQLMDMIRYWLPRSSKSCSQLQPPTTHEELVSFIKSAFESFQREETDCWSQINNMHLMTPQMLHLYQKKFIQIQSMNWIQLMCYKTVLCANGRDCRSYREQKMLHNQFYDFELQCPFFHDVKDRKRLVLPVKADEEFKYKGKYREPGLNEDGSDGTYSHNYFESVFHPLFYKFFDCKRLQCKGSIYCPMKHSEEERVAWEEEFSLCWKKDRSIYYPKKKKNSSDFSDGSFEDKLHGTYLKQHYTPINQCNNSNYTTRHVHQYHNNQRHQQPHHHHQHPKYDHSRHNLGSQRSYHSRQNGYSKPCI